MTSNFEAENLQMESYKNFMVKKNKSALLVACMRSNKHATKKQKKKKCPDKHSHTAACT